MAESREEAMMHAMDAYDEAEKEQIHLNGLCKKGLVEVMQAKMRLEQTEARELHPEDYPEAAEAKVKITYRKGKLDLMQAAKVTDPSTYFSRSPDGLASVQSAYVEVLQSALRLSEKRQTLKELAEQYKKLRG